MALINKDIGVGGEWFEKELGQLQPGNTTAVSIYSPPSNIISCQIISIFIANSMTGASPAYSLFLDQDGTTYDASTTLAFEVSLASNTTDLIEPTGMFMNNASGNLAVQTDTNDSLTFTVYGIEILTQQA